jgi:hypothetical protein
MKQSANQQFPCGNHGGAGRYQAETMFLPHGFIFPCTVALVSRAAPPLFHPAGSSCHTAAANHRVAGTFSGVAGGLSGAVESSCRTATGSNHPAESPNRVATTSDRMAGSIRHAAEPFCRTGKSFCRAVFRQKPAKNAENHIFSLIVRRSRQRLGLRKSSAALASPDLRWKSGRGLPHSKTLRIHALSTLN